MFGDLRPARLLDGRRVVGRSGVGRFELARVDAVLDHPQRQELLPLLAEDHAEQSTSSSKNFRYPEGEVKRELAPIVAQYLT